MRFFKIFQLYVILASFFKISTVLVISWHVIRLVCRAVTIFSSNQRSWLEWGLFRYCENIRKPHRKFCRSFWKSFTSKNEFCKNIPSSILSLFFSKSQIFAVFPVYNVISVSSGHDCYWFQSNMILGKIKKEKQDFKDFSREENLKSTYSLLICPASCYMYSSLTLDQVT